jgi:hypothetical protein
METLYESQPSHQQTKAKTGNSRKLPRQTIIKVRFFLLLFNSWCRATERVSSVALVYPSASEHANNAITLLLLATAALCPSSYLSLWFSQAPESEGAFAAKATARILFRISRGNKHVHRS